MLLLTEGIGHEYIMTFKDASVLMPDNDEGDEEMLENIELQSSFKQKMVQRRKAQASAASAYNGNGGDEIELKKVLPQYDDGEEEELNKKKSRITLSKEGDAGLNKEQVLEELREKLSLKGKTKVSLDITKVSLITFAKLPARM